MLGVLLLGTLILFNPVSTKGIKIIDVDVPFARKTPTEEDYLKEDRHFWMKIGTETLRKNLDLRNQETLHVAKNVIIFIGDGFGISTITAARIYKGQNYLGKFGEEHRLTFEQFPDVALVKTYNIDKQVPDSAGTATAIFSGVKTRYEVVGQDVTSEKVEGVMHWAQSAGKATGIVTTASLMDATPACTYAHIYHRDLVCDEKVDEMGKPSVKDIARQLVEDAPGKNFKVVLGGGQNNLGYLSGGNDEECIRKDGLNLTKIWIDDHNGTNYVFAANADDLKKVDEDTDYLFGVFAPKDFPGEILKEEGIPTLTTMTEKALKILKKSPTGFVLMVEGALIDKAHHENYAKYALEEAAELDNAINLALEETGEDTLILVTADHSHSFTFNGYGTRGADILGTTYSTDDQKHYSILSYANGPGFSYHYAPNNTNSSNPPWKELEGDLERYSNPKYRHPASWVLIDETHGGEDVAVYAKGPNSNLIRGTFEQNYIAHVVSYSACIGPHAEQNVHCNGAMSVVSCCGFALFCLLLLIRLF